MKTTRLLALSLLLCVLFASCGAASNSLRDEAENGLYAKAYRAEAPAAAMEMAAEDGGFYYAASGADAPAEKAKSTVSEEKLVYTSNVSLETEDFDASSAALHQKITSLGGIIVSENAYNLGGVNRYGDRTLQMTVRIPQVNYDAFLSGLSENGNVVSVANSVQNMTEQYYDNENRLASLRVQEARLIEMLGEAKTVSEMLEIESRLSEIQYRIESLTNTQRTIDNDVKYATFYLSLTEVKKYTEPEPQTFGERFVQAVRGSIDSFRDGCADFSIGFVYALPRLILLALLVWIVIACIKGHKRRKAKKARKAAEEKEVEKK